MSGCWGVVVPWVFSAKSELALREQAARVGGHVGGVSGLGVADVGLSLAGRSVFEWRGVVVGAGREELLGGVDVLRGGGSAAGVVEGVVSGGGGLAVLFTGQGAQRVGMGRELYEAFGVFRGVVDEVCVELDERLGCSLRDVVFGGLEGGGGLLDRTLFTQAGLFAVEVALFRLVESWGVRPDFVMGHSIGELSAAHVAGVLSLGDACALVAAARAVDGWFAGGWRDGLAGGF